MAASLRPISTATTALLTASLGPAVKRLEKVCVQRPGGAVKQECASSSVPAVETQHIARRKQEQRVCPDPTQELDCQE